MNENLLKLAQALEYPHNGSDEQQELYTATFDVTPVCVPYVSIHLFGEENFKRGEFMAALHARYAQAGFNMRGELADHITVLLRFAAQVDEEERRELAQFCLLGPVRKMIASLTADNPYRAVLEAVVAEFPEVQPVLMPVEQMDKHDAGCAGCGVTVND